MRWKKYRVSLFRTIEQHASVVVEAKSEKDVEEQLEQLYWRYHGPWEEVQRVPGEHDVMDEVWSVEQPVDISLKEIEHEERILGRGIELGVSVVPVVAPN